MIEVEYDCHLCGVAGGRVQVRERGPAEDVAEWMRTLTLALAVAHGRASPRCRATHIDRVKIPLAPDGGRIGDPTQH
jgi:hypothetical protein